jgi:D-cysteine desulfhydrase
VFLGDPTPVELLTLPGLPADRVFVKRDERSCPQYGGNKPRKLEFVIGHALARGAQRLLTTGALGTHHGLATTILARVAGLATTLVLVDQPLSDEVEESLLLFAAYGAELRYAGNVPGAALQCARVLARGVLRRERVQLVPTGGSGAVGNLGFVSAAYELADQVRAGLLPEPASLYVPVGTGGTQAGLVVGLRLAGLRTRVVGVLVSDILPPSPSGVARAAGATLRRLRAADASIAELRFEPDDFPQLCDQLGPGYGARTEAALEAVRLARGSGLELETTYTAKCLAAILARARAHTLEEGPVLFWNTFNGVDVKARAPGPLDPAGLPPAFRRILARRPRP